MWLQLGARLGANPLGAIKVVLLLDLLAPMGCTQGPELVVQAKGAYTSAGTWAPNEEEARMIEAIVDRDEAWEESLKGREQYIDRPIQPPGLLGSGAPNEDPKALSRI